MGLVSSDVHPGPRALDLRPGACSWSHGACRWCSRWGVDWAPWAVGAGVRREGIVILKQNSLFCSLETRQVLEFSRPPCVSEQGWGCPGAGHSWGRALGGRGAFPNTRSLSLPLSASWNSANAHPRGGDVRWTARGHPGSRPTDVLRSRTSCRSRHFPPRPAAGVTRPRQGRPFLSETLLFPGPHSSERNPALASSVLTRRGGLAGGVREPGARVEKGRALKEQGTWRQKRRTD